MSSLGGITLTPVNPPFGQGTQLPNQTTTNHTTNFANLTQLTQSSIVSSTGTGGTAFTSSFQTIPNGIRSFIHAKEFSRSTLAIKIFRYVQFLIAFAAFLFLAIHIIEVVFATQIWTLASVVLLFFYAHPAYLGIILVVFLLDLGITIGEYYHEHQLGKTLIFQEEAVAILTKSPASLTQEEIGKLIDIIKKNEEELKKTLPKNLIDRYVDKLTILSLQIMQDTDRKIDTFKNKQRFLFLANYLSLIQLKKKNLSLDNDTSNKQILTTLDQFYPSAYTALKEIYLLINDYPTDNEIEHPFQSIDKKHALNNPFTRAQETIKCLNHEFQKKHAYTLRRMIFLSIYIASTVFSFIYLYIQGIQIALYIIFNLLYSIVYIIDTIFCINNWRNFSKEAPKNIYA